MSTSTTEHITLLAPDISCGHCVSTVQDALGKHEGVKLAMANAETKHVDIDFDPTVTSVDKLSTTLAQAGYPVKS